MQEPELSLWHVHYGHIFRKKKWLSEENLHVRYSNLQLYLSRGLFPYALPTKILQHLATFPCMLQVTKI